MTPLLAQAKHSEFNKTDAKQSCGMETCLLYFTISIRTFMLIKMIDRLLSGIAFVQEKLFQRAYEIPFGGKTIFKTDSDLVVSARGEPSSVQDNLQRACQHSEGTSFHMF
jgi:hypothetical protein